MLTIVCAVINAHVRTVLVVVVGDVYTSMAVYCRQYVVVCGGRLVARRLQRRLLDVVATRNACRWHGQLARHIHGCEYALTADGCRQRDQQRTDTQHQFCARVGVTVNVASTIVLAQYYRTAVSTLDLDRQFDTLFGDLFRHANVDASRQCEIVQVFRACWVSSGVRVCTCGILDQHTPG